MNKDKCVDIIKIILDQMLQDMHSSNETSVINDKDDYGHQTVLHPSNETTSGENMRD